MMKNVGMLLPFRSIEEKRCFSAFNGSQLSSAEEARKESEFRKYSATWRGDAKQVYGQKIKREGRISVSESRFSSSSPFFFSPSISLISLFHLVFFNISTANEACSPSTTMSTQTSCFMSSCSFSSVCNAYDGGIVPSLNNPYASLTASNTSFVGCFRTRNVVCEGTSDVKLTPERQSITENIANTFTWCEWNGSKTTGDVDDHTDRTSNGGAINMNNLASASISIQHCTFNNCYAHYGGGGVICRQIKTLIAEDNTFNDCTAQSYYGGGLYVYYITSCVRISGCEFQGCKASIQGGGLFLENFQVSGPGCIPTENGGGESACVFDCSFASCSVTSTTGGGMRCYNVPNQFKMRSIQFISCSATAYGGGLSFRPEKSEKPDDGFYCYFLFFHECKCRDESNPYGHDAYYVDYYNVFLSTGNPFYECYTTNTDDQRMCYVYNYSSSGSWVYDQTMKMDWLKRGILNRFVAASGGNEEELCGLDESSACRTIGVAVEKSMIQVSLSVTLLEGKHTSETKTIEIGTKKISAIGKDKEKYSIGTKTNLNRSFSSSSSACYFSF
ncbi:uncharacterized protein MONOS_14211 [Monocercomonoides exilis]|uniref:uncharacterized protein n=1 Tax=Monocercomonoides exilis TaxID=2049356 RepID=UPI00355A5113|nr:hypothetical protein MONOS_14211 [Monocercomonoides exilis]|eukprot:MONOS_14211.1-p1 / transcript=MONOS_14211.1 / gene=MONOS_14211 / organism=Monocercomonoides_exilis_PA203 / gene_product=unspecified product / transcript_product=unspecified product / location=Mono_scaffold00956:18108-19784(-) / protein_length=559 / sequence_SO=supercontig / SO=protein_coding / is_pseudo=false